VAPAGGVMLSAATARLVEGTATLGESELVQIKNADAPVRTRRLLHLLRASACHRISVGPGHQGITPRHPRSSVWGHLGGRIRSRRAISSRIRPGHPRWNRSRRAISRGADPVSGLSPLRRGKQCSRFRRGGGEQCSGFRSSEERFEGEVPGGGPTSSRLSVWRSFRGPCRP